MKINYRIFHNELVLTTSPQLIAAICDNVKIKYVKVIKQHKIVQTQTVVTFKVMSLCHKVDSCGCKKLRIKPAYSNSYYIPAPFLMDTKYR